MIPELKKIFWYTLKSQIKIKKYIINLINYVKEK